MGERAGQWFAYDPEGDGFVIFETEDEARKSAQNALDAERDQSGEYGWNDLVTSICWGRVVGVAAETMRRPVDRGEDSMDPQGLDEIVEYELKESPHDQ